MATGHDRLAPKRRGPVDPASAQMRLQKFRDLYGMPFALAAKERTAGTGRGCRAVVAARLLDPGSEWRVFRALQLANFTTQLLLDDDDSIRVALSSVAGIDGEAIVDHLDALEVTEAYERDRVEARSARGSAAEAQGKTSTSDGPVRYTAPSVVFERDARRLVAGGWQPFLAYDVLIANLDPGLTRTPPPKDPVPLLERFSDGLTTAEVAALLAPGPDYLPDHSGAEQALLRAVGEGDAVRVALGHDALWTASGSVGSARTHSTVAAVA